MFDTAPADLVENNGFMSCFQMFDRIHDGYSKAHGRGFQFTPGHVCISCADVLYYILRQSVIFVKLAAMRQVKKWSISPCALWSKVCVPLSQILHCAAILQCEAFFYVPKGTLNSKKALLHPADKRVLFRGMPDGIRTHDLQSRSLTLYPAELRAHIIRIIARKLGFGNHDAHLIFYVCKSK